MMSWTDWPSGDEAQACADFLRDEMGYTKFTFVQLSDGVLLIAYK